METTTTYTCEADPDEFSVCETCETTVFDDDCFHCEESGITTCSPCEHAYYREMERACRGYYPSDEQLRRDHEDTIAWCGYGSDEAIKSGMLLR